MTCFGMNQTCLKNLNDFLDICNRLEIRPILVLFDDCHRPYPKLGKQPKPVGGVHNSGWNKALVWPLSMRFIKRTLMKFHDAKIC